MRITKIAMKNPSQNKNTASPDFKVNMNDDKRAISESKKSYLNGLIKDLSGPYRGIDKAFSIVIWLLQNQDIIIINSDGSEWKGFLSGSKPCDNEGPEKNKLWFDLAERDNIQSPHPSYHPVRNKLCFGWCISATDGMHKIYNILAYVD